MSTRFIKDTIWTSPNLNQLSDLAERHFYRLLPLPDDHGCCELSPDVIKGRCYPKKPKITEAMIQKWTQELVDADIIRVWEEKGRLYGWFPTWSEHQRVRSLNKRKTPEPPSHVVNCRQVSLNVASPSPVPCPSSLPTPQISSPPAAGATSGKLVSVADVIAEGADQKHAEDWLKIRRDKRKPLTRTAWEGIKREAAKARLTIAQVVKLMAEKSWLSFEADWIAGKSLPDTVKPRSETCSAPDCARPWIIRREGRPYCDSHRPDAQPVQNSPPRVPTPTFKGMPSQKQT